MKEAIQIIQMRSLPTPPPPPPVSSPPPQAVKGLFCPQRVMSAWPIENSRRVLRDECPGWAQWPQFEYHADICQIGAPNKRKEGYSAPIQACCYFISRKFASSIYSFCSFSSVYGVWNTRATWRGRPLFWTEFYFCWHVTETPCSCLCLTADLHGLGQPLPRQVRTQASDQGPANRRHGRSAAGWDHTGRR